MEGKKKQNIDIQVESKLVLKNQAKKKKCENNINIKKNTLRQVILLRTVRLFY